MRREIALVIEEMQAYSVGDLKRKFCSPYFVCLYLTKKFMSFLVQKKC